VRATGSIKPLCGIPVPQCVSATVACSVCGCWEGRSVAKTGREPRALATCISTRIPNGFDDTIAKRRISLRTFPISLFPAKQKSGNACWGSVVPAGRVLWRGLWFLHRGLVYLIRGFGPSCGRSSESRARLQALLLTRRGLSGAVAPVCGTNIGGRRALTWSGLRSIRRSHCSVMMFDWAHADRTSAPASAGFEFSPHVTPA